MTADRRDGLSLFMILPSAVRHFKHLTFIPPEVEIVNQVTRHGIAVLRVVPSCTFEHPEHFSKGNETSFYVPMRLKVGLIPKVLDHIRKWGLVNREFRRSPCDLIFLRNDIAPAILFDGLQALYLRWRYGAHLVFQVENPLGQNLASRLTQGQRSHRSARMISLFEEVVVRRLIYRADLVLPINELLRDDLLAMGVEDRRITIIHEGVDMSRFQEPEGESIRERYGLGDATVIVYSGMIDRTRNLRTLILAFAELRKRGRAKLLLVGDGNDARDLAALVKEMGLQQDVTFTGWVAQDLVPNYIAAGDVGVCLVPPLSYYKKSSPLKMLEYMAAGRAVIANHEIPEQKLIVEESGCGLLVDYEPGNIAEGLENLIREPERLKALGSRGRQWVMANRSYDVLSRQVAERLSDLKGKGV